MSRVFISDLHLESEHDAKYRAFRRVLEAASQRGDELYILGDLVEVWVGDDDDSSFAQTLSRDLLDCASDVYVMSGNRDFLYRDGFAQASEVTLIPDPYLLHAEDMPERTLLAHGDAYCTSDHAYMQLRQLFRSSAWQDQTLATTLAERREFASSLRAQSKAANQLKAANITDVVEAEITTALAEHECTLMIHGHTHRPGMHRMSKTTRRVVLGDWLDCGWLVRQHGDTITLERFAI